MIDFEPVDQAAIDAAHPIEVDEDGRLCYRLYSQDGRFIEMTCQDSPDMRRFVRWTRRFDRYGGFNDKA